MTAPAWAGRAADRVLARVAGAPARLGAGLLVCIDGPSGSGKTTLAAEVAARAKVRDPFAPAPDRVRVLHLDDLYPGWDGLLEGVRRLDDHVLAPLVRGETGHFCRYAWVSRREGPRVEVPPGDLLVVEGSGCGSTRHRAQVACLVWVEVPAADGLARALSRDGIGTREDLARWRAAEDRLFARTCIRERADLVISGTDGAEPPATEPERRG